MKKTILIIVLAIIVIAGFLLYNSPEENINVTDFQSCANAGYPLTKSIPRQCETPSGQVFYEETNNNKPREEQGNNSTPNCPEGYFPESTNCECAKGYIKTGQGGNPPPEAERRVACTVDIAWEDLETCESDSDCPEDYSCISKDTINIEYRCVPPDYRNFDCFCTPESGCVCA